MVLGSLVQCTLVDRWDLHSTKAQNGGDKTGEEETVGACGWDLHAIWSKAGSVL